MNEKGTKRREWVKTAAIIFLSVLLVLTFFSNTIMNYSLPEVAAQYVQSGTVTAKIRGTGVVESGDPYNVMVKETRKVASVAVKEGDTVQQGDVLMYLEDSESEELKTAQEALKTAQDAYDVALLSADVNANVLQGMANGTPTMTYRQQITNAQSAVEAEQKKVDEWQEKYDAFTTQIAITPENDADTEDEGEALDNAKKAKDAADNALADVNNIIETLKLEIASLESRIDYAVSTGDAAQEELLNQEKAAKELEMLDRQKDVKAAELAVKDAQFIFDRAQKAYDNKVAEGDNKDSIASLQHQQAKVKAELDAATRVLEVRKKELTDLTANINKTLSLETLYDAIVKAQEEVTKQTEKSIGATVTADIAGTVTSVNITAGKETSAAEPVAVLQPEGKGFSMSFSVTNEQAKRLAVGDKADLVNSWRYEDVEVTLASIKPDKQEPGQKKLLTFDVTGSVTAGQTLNVSVGQKSANYDYIVPNSAIREDNNGKFILIVESKSSPLSTRYYASRVDVEVLASDDTQSAVSGGLYGYEFVITTSTAPVEAGQLVRLADS